MSSSFELNFKNNIFFGEYSIEKPEPISKKKPKPYKELKKLALNNIHKRYGAKAKLKYTYTGLIMENLIFNKNTHLVSIFKDYMIWDYIEEFLKRFYRKEESKERVPKFASFYKNYLKFFCVPTFKDIFYNEMIHNYSEKKAELFYNENYKSKKEKNSFQEDYGLLEESESDEESDTSNANNNIEKTIFNETVKKKIEKYSPINTSMALPESDTKLKPDDSGLLITSSNETSLVNIMKGMSSPPPHPQNNQGSKTKRNNESNNKNKNKDKNNKKSGSKNNNHNDENSNSYRMSQKNLIHSSLNKFNNKTIEALLNSQMKNRNKNLLHYNNYSNHAQKNNNNRINSRDNNRNNSNNKVIKNNMHHNSNNLNKNKIMSYIGIYKKKSIPKSRNEDKSPEEIIKYKTQINNFINGSTNSNTNINNGNNANNIDNLKNNNMKINLNLNQLGINLSNRTKNITSINNYNLNYKQSIQKSRNQQQSISINSNTYSKYSFDRINNIKKKINLFKNNNIEYILNQLKFRPFCTLKKNSNRKAVQSNSNRNKKEEKKNSKINNALNNNEGRNSVKTRTLSSQHHHGISPNANKTKFQNSPSAFDFLKKTSEYIKNMNGKGSHSKDVKVYKKSERNCSYNEWQKSYAEDKTNSNNNNLKNKNTNNKMSFEGILSNNIRGNNNTQKKSKTINNNGSKHIHNVNININNQINIGGKQFHELFSFSDLVKKHSNNANIKNLFSLSKNKDKKVNYVSRNKNQSLDFNAYTHNQNQINNMNSIGSNKVNSIGDGQNNNIYKTQYKINSKRFSANSNKNKIGNKKIRLTNNALFRSMRVINNNNNYNHYNKIKK